MAKPRVRLDLKGLEEVGSSKLMQFLMRGAATTIAENVREQGIMVGSTEKGSKGEIPLPVEVNDVEVTTDMQVNRATASVSLAHPAGQAVQAKNGALTKAAGQAGLKVKGTKR